MAITRIGNIASTIPDDSIQNAKFSNIVQSKNIIINGDMNIAQRGTSFTSASGYTLDRYTWTDDSTSAFTITQSTDVPTGQGFAKSMKFDCTTANGSLGSSDQIRQVQQIEGQNLQYLRYGTSSAESLTCSFWVKSNKTGIYCVTLSQPDDSYASNTVEYTISSANTWEKKTATFSGDTGGVITNDNTSGLWLMFAFGAGSGRHMTANQWNSSYGLSTSNQVNLADSTSNELYLTGVQLEAGTSASDFEFLPVDVNKNRCLRYYYVHAEGDQKEIACGFYYTSSYLTCHLQFPQEMRSAPSLIKTSGTNYYRAWRAGSSDLFDDFNDGIQSATTTSCGMDGSTGVSGTQGEGNRIITVNSSSLIAFNAEL